MHTFLLYERVGPPFEEHVVYGYHLTFMSRARGSRAAERAVETRSARGKRGVVKRMVFSGLLAVMCDLKEKSCCLA
jgi:hypothetical protein